MTRQEESIKQRTFVILWDKTEEPSYYDRYTVREWLKDEGWPLLFPGHCFTCHMNEHDQCKSDGHLSCPACWEQVKPKPLSTECVCGHSLNWHRESHTDKKGCMVNVHVDEDHGTERCECEAFVADDDMINLTHSGTVTDCVGGSCGCKEGARE